MDSVRAITLVEEVQRSCLWFLKRDTSYLKYRTCYEETNQSIGFPICIACVFDSILYSVKFHCFSILCETLHQPGGKKNV